MIYLRTAMLALGIVLFLTISRVILVVFHWDRVDAADGAGFILLQGLRFDLIFLGLSLGLVFLLKPWLHLRTSWQRVGCWILAVYMGGLVALVFFIEASTLSFIAEYDSRPNYIFVEYLVHPREVLATLSGSHLPELIGFVLISLFLGWFTFHWLRKESREFKAVSFMYCLWVTPVTLVLVFMMVRSSLDHRPASPSNAAFSQDAMVNQLALNSPYSLIYAIYEQRRDSTKQAARYGEMTDDKVMALVLKEARIPPRNQLDPAIPTLHQQRAKRVRNPPLNLVIILQESLGAEHVGALGGKNLTPRLDSLSTEGIWFERLYATGMRSARGIEAVITGFTPAYTQSVIKLAETQDNFFTIADLLKDHGYKTSFIYGGDAHFDNMKRFFLNNGFETVIDQDNYDSPEFRGAWGVSDEDLFNRAHQEFTKHEGQPFFSLVFTSSNHDPFDIPADRVIAETGEQGPRDTAMKYADYALGQFIDQARKSAYWKNTIFLVIADHSSRVYGARLVPVERFRIPGVILGHSVKPRRVSGISSQIDMVPTLLSLIGLNSTHPAIGRDLTRPRYLDGAGRAMMQFNSLYAYLEEDQVIVLQPDRKPRSFLLGSSGELLRYKDGPASLKKKALAHALWGPLMIRQGYYRR